MIVEIRPPGWYPLAKESFKVSIADFNSKKIAFTRKRFFSRGFGVKSYSVDSTEILEHYRKTSDLSLNQSTIYASCLKGKTKTGKNGRPCLPVLKAAWAIRIVYNRSANP